VQALTSFKSEEYKEELLEVIQKGLKDRTTMIRAQSILVGSVLIDP